MKSLLFIFFLLYSSTIRSELSEYAFLPQEMQIENLVEQRLNHMISGFLSPSDFFLYAVVALKRDDLKQEFEPLTEQALVLPLSEKILQPADLWQMKDKDISVKKMFASIASIKVNLTLSDRVSESQKEAIVNAISSVLKQQAGDLTQQSITVYQAPKPASNLKQPNQNNNSNNKESSANAKSQDKAKEADFSSLKSLEGELANSDQLFKPLTPEEEVEAEAPPQKTIENEYINDYSLMFLAQLPLTAILLGLISLLGLRQYLKFKYKALHADKKETPQNLDDRTANENKQKEPESENKVEEVSDVKVINDWMVKDFMSIERDDLGFIESLITALSVNPSRYAISRLIDEWSAQETYLTMLISVLSLLGEKQYLLLRLLSTSTAIRLKQAIAEMKSREPLDYEQSLAASQEFLSKYELHKRSSKNFGITDEELVYLSDLDESVILRYIAGDNALESAVLLSLYSPEKCGKLITRLDGKIKLKVYQAFSNIHHFSPILLKEVFTKLKSNMGSTNGIVVDGKRYLMEIMQHSDEEEAKNVVQAISDNAFRTELSQSFVTPKHLLHLDDNSLKILLSEFDPKTVAYFLSKANSKIRQVVLSLQTERSQSIINDIIQSASGSGKNRHEQQLLAAEAHRLILGRLKELIMQKEVVLNAEEVRSDSYFSNDSTQPIKFNPSNNDGFGETPPMAA